MRAATFPWPSPVPGDLRDLGGASTAERSREIVLWFVDHWAPAFRLPHTSPLAQLLDQIDMSARGGAPAEIPDHEVAALQHRLLMLRRLAHGISALHGTAGTLREVHQSFITKALAGSDEPSARFRMPGGVGTICLAARLMQASGGEMGLLGEGQAAAGHDLWWKPRTGGEAVIERKDRAWERGAREPLGRRIAYAVSKVIDAGPRLPRRPGTARVLTIGFPGVITAEMEQKVRAEINDGLANALGPELPEHSPDCLVLDTLGGETDEDDSFTPWVFTHMLELTERPEWLAVRGAFARAFIVAAAQEPGPWLIRADWIPNAGA